MIKLDYNKKNEKRISITGKSEIFRANVKDIIYIICEEYVSTIYLKNGKTCSVTHSLKCFEAHLKEEDDFFRVSRNTLVNIEHFVNARITHKERIANINGVDIKISRRKIARLKKLLCG